MIIYIHGFGGSGQGSKAKIFREYYKNKSFIAPSLPYVLALAIQTLDELLNYDEAVQKLQGCKVTIQDSGNHSFEDIDEFLKGEQ
ncbi:MAG TPA: hypothetical protein EYG73_02080 [Arcobacter sp.]|nr:hypothetical protein [Arcobacter sp.]